jgi:hypothetical protein
MKNIYELIQTPINEAQKKIIEHIRMGSHGDSFTKYEVADMVIKVMVAVDYDAHEKPYLDKCINRAIRAGLSLAGGAGVSTYISKVKNQMASTSYFKIFDQMSKARGRNAMSVICSELSRRGLAEVVVGNRIRMTDLARDLVGENNG